MLGGLLTFFSSSKNSIMFGLGAIAAVGWAMWYFSDQAYDKLLVDSAKKIERAQENVVKAESALKATNDALAALKQQNLEDYKMRFEQDMIYAADRKELQQLREKLNSYEERWANVATKKPELVARIVNRAWLKRMRKIETATCRTDCGTNKNTESGP